MKTKAPPKMSKTNRFEACFGMTSADARERIDTLTPREHEVIGQFSKGLKSRVIAEALGISTKTLDIHRGNILRKLRVRSVVAMTNVFHLVRLTDEPALAHGPELLDALEAVMKACPSARDATPEFAEATLQAAEVIARCRE